MSEPIPPMSEQEAFEKAFSWLPLDHQSAKHVQFRALTVDVCRGIQTCLEVAHFRTLDKGVDAAPKLDPIDAERLLRLARSSSQLLAEIAARHREELKAENDKESRKKQP